MSLNSDIEEYYTDTAGFTDHVFALTHLLGFRFAPRIRDLNDKQLFVSASILKDLPALSSMIGQKLNIKLIEDYWDDILRLASSIRQGSVSASLILRKLGSYPRQNGLALALREFGRLERTLFMLEWIQSPELRRRVQVGLNKGEARNALASAVFLTNWVKLETVVLSNSASGLNLVTAAIVLWNTIYLEKAVGTLRKQGIEVDDKLHQHISPLGWEHIALTGEYRWSSPCVG
ncbi:Tn3 family transposase [Candidatus Enterovibrio escicola]|uniref:Tn3 family transposase n=1 Tax=Candidatus Enterovibrio escicola TaxID=1927127 RepID=UPI0012383D62|nr:Tn3 family transposase [Candidatus Enterovibrio escacola]